jgi:hypothetical protein
MLELIVISPNGVAFEFRDGDRNKLFPMSHPACPELQSQTQVPVEALPDERASAVYPLSMLMLNKLLLGPVSSLLNIR